LNGIRTKEKLSNFKKNICLLTPFPDLIVLTETNLCKNISDSELGLNLYDIYRRDRYGYFDPPNGGGVLIAVSKKLSSSLLLCDLSCEQIFVKLSCQSRNILIGATYIPPSSESDIYHHHVNMVDELSSKYEISDIILLGDYNLPKVNWCNYDSFTESLSVTCYNQSNLIADNADIVVSGFSFLDLKQYFPINKKKGYTLDLAFSNLVESQVKVEVANDSLSKIEFHHDPVMFTFELLDNFVYLPQEFDKKNFYKADFIKIGTLLDEINWEMILDENKLEQNVDTFYNIIGGIIDDKELVPEHKVVASNYPEWFSYELIKSIIKKKKLHKIWIQSNVENDYIAFKRQRAICIRLSRLDYNKFIDKIEEKTAGNIKTFWNYVNKLSKSNSIPSSMFLNNKSAHIEIDICNLFSEYFTNSHKIIEPLHSELIFDDVILDMEITETEISNAISTLKDKVAVGIDGVPDILLKKCSGYLLRPLMILFNQSVNEGYVPKIWKKSFVIPVFKSGDRADISNYRPITIMGSIAKILDAIMAQKLSQRYLMHIIAQQHGFVKGRSTLTNLLVYSDYIANALNNCKQVDSIYLDFKKAFDSVDHSILVYKLQNFGMQGSLLKWIKSYLIGRESVVKINKHSSVPYAVSSGVPQGSHLGPLLFILFINDVASGLKHVNILIFADDIKLFRSIDCVADQNRFQEDLDYISNWAMINRLELNCDKCKLMTFSRNSSNVLPFNYNIFDLTVDRVDSHRDLGIIFESSFEFKKHLDSIVSKAMRTLGFIFRSVSDFKNPSTMVYLYKTLVRPVLLNDHQIWSPFYKEHEKRLESVQHKFFRKLSYRMGRPMRFDDHNYSVIASKYELSTIKSLHLYYDLFFVKKVLSGLIRSDDVISLFVRRVLPYDIRQSGELVQTFSSKNYVINSGSFKLRREWNGLSIDVRNSLKLSEFKIALKEKVLNYA